jgi:hypothetical protein
MATIDDRVTPDDYDPWAHWADEPDADPAPAVWPDRTHDGQRMRDTDTADVDRRVL